ncbi:MAG: hypothetical protein M1827_000156 [Pycnora praestabilis]|nr:MAG: hypothetical protein M1827_000156 [Pycnora praestabilis]
MSDADGLILGGSQVVTFASAAAKCCDPTRLIADSVNHQEPIIIVSLNYRLNIFAFGDGKGETNLALKDQRLGIDWVVKHISGFGGDKNNITLAGESAGGVYVHAHSILNAPVRRAILSSGSLWLSPPLPLVRGQSLVDNLSKRVEESEKASLRDAPATSLVHHLNEMGIKSMWLQAEPGLADWDKKAENIEELIIGDVEYETVIWRNGIESMTSSQIVSAFSLAPRSAELQRLYGISSSRSTSSKIGALDFIHDLKFTWPVETIATRWRTKGKPVYQYIVDQTNPWQSSNRAHHTVDLILLFGGYDLSFNPAAEAVGQEMRARWINFVNGQPPWSAERRMAFGPFGESKEIGEREFAARRRVRHMELLKEIGLEELNPVFAALAAGRISLEN